MTVRGNRGKAKQTFDFNLNVFVWIWNAWSIEIKPSIRIKTKQNGYCSSWVRRSYFSRYFKRKMVGNGVNTLARLPDRRAPLNQEASVDLRTFFPPSLISLDEAVFWARPIKMASFLWAFLTDEGLQNFWMKITNHFVGQFFFPPVKSF